MTTQTETRPGSLDEMVGQADTIRRMRLALNGARERGVKAPHVLLSGPAGFGKTSLARIVASETGGTMLPASGPSLSKTGDLAGILCSADDGDVLFIDEIHRLPIAVAEALYEVLEDGTLTIVIGSGTQAKTMMLRLANLVIVGATTKPGALPTPLRDRFGLQLTMQPYTVDDIAEIVRRQWDRMGATYLDGSAQVVAERSKGIPRLAIHLADRVLDVAAVSRESVTPSTATLALEAFGVGKDGIDEIDHRILVALVVTFAGKPVGLSNLGSALDLDPATIQDQHEPSLVRAGLVVRTPSGRMATPMAHDWVRAAA